MATLTKLGIFDNASLRFISQDNLDSIYVDSQKGDISIVYSEDGEKFSDIYVTGEDQNNSANIKVHHIAGGYGFNEKELRDWLEEHSQEIQELLSNISENKPSINRVENFKFNLKIGNTSYSDLTEKDTIYCKIPLIDLNGSDTESEDNIKIKITSISYYYPGDKILGKMFFINDTTNYVFNVNDNTGFSNYEKSWGNQTFVERDLTPILSNKIYKDIINTVSFDNEDNYTILPLSTTDINNSNLEKRFMFIVKTVVDTNIDYQIIYGPKIVFEYPILTYCCVDGTFENINSSDIILNKEEVNLYSFYHDMEVTISNNSYSDTDDDFSKPKRHYIYVPRIANDVRIISAESNINGNFIKLANEYTVDTDISGIFVYYNIYKSAAQYLGPKTKWILKNIK